MSQIDVSFVNFFLPVLGFLLVLLVVIAILVKTKILGENGWVNFLVGLMIAGIFLAAAGNRVLIQTIVPWFAVLLVCLFLVLLMIGFVGKPIESMTGLIGKIFVGILLLTFVFSVFYVYSETLRGYVPGPAYGSNADVSLLYFTDWIYSPEVIGAIILIAVSAIVAWIIIKK